MTREINQNSIDLLDEVLPKTDFRIAQELSASKYEDENQLHCRRNQAEKRIENIILRDNL